MLRKTTANQVAAIYSDFFERFPSVASLAEADPADVMVVIRSLGIRNRAFDLVNATKEISNRHDGIVPRDLGSLLSLRGVGLYIAGCILVHGYGLPQPLVDSNVERVLSRVLGLKGKPDVASRKTIREAYSDLAPKGDLRDFHYALVDLSNIHCRAKLPDCRGCPIGHLCKSVILDS